MQQRPRLAQQRAASAHEPLQSVAGADELFHQQLELDLVKEAGHVLLLPHTRGQTAASADEESGIV